MFKLFFKISLILISIIFTTYSISAYASCSKSLIISYNDWVPYTYTDNDGEIVGLDAEIIDLVMKNAGCDYSFIKIPPKRAFLELEKGRIDMMIGASITEGRKKYGKFTQSYREEVLGAIVRKGESAQYPYKDLQSMIGQDVMIGAINGSWYGPEYGQLQKDEEFQKQLSMVNSNRQRIGMLVKNRIDMVIGDPVGLINSARENNQEENVEFHPINLYQGYVHFLLGHVSTSQNDLDLINLSLEVVKKSGALQEIIDRYLKN